MKLRLLAVVVSTLPLLSVEAGSFAGPPPFTNGSPLVTGVTGTYQATARARSLSGIIVFTYNQQGNPSTTGQNNYVFFVNGTIVSGTVQASIQNTKLSGILNTPATPNVPPTLVNFDSLGGSFSASFNTKSPIYGFSGKGVLSTYVQTSVTGTMQYVPRNFRLQGMRTSLN